MHQLDSSLGSQSGHLNGRVLIDLSRQLRKIFTALKVTKCRAIDDDLGFNFFKNCNEGFFICDIEFIMSQRKNGSVEFGIFTDDMSSKKSPAA